MTKPTANLDPKDGGEPIDVVYTWVDDTWPGYLELRNEFATVGHDLNPNRTRDNLDILRFSLRSLCTHIPWVRNIYLFTMRPQIPNWLDTGHPRIRVVHHDEVMSPEILPTFNSFAILSHLHLIDGLSERFIYICDDFLMGAPVDSADLIGEGATDPMYFESRFAPAPSLKDSDRRSPWDAGRAYTNKLLDDAFGAKKRRDVGHIPTVFRRSVWGSMIERWPEDFARTRRSRFRAKYNVVPEFLYPHYLIETGLGHQVPLELYRRLVHYVSIDNFVLKARYDIWRIGRRNAKFYALNDSFGHNPNPWIVARWREVLHEMFPVPCMFEK